MARAKEEIKAELDEMRDALDKAEKRLEALEKNYSRRVAERDDALRRKSAKEVISPHLSPHLPTSPPPGQAPTSA